MHKLKFSLILLSVLSVSFMSCLKDKAFLDVSNTQPVIEFAFGTNGQSDLGNFGLDPTLDVLDTAIAVNIASPQALDYPVTVTLQVDTTQITKYNSVDGNTQLAPLPDSTYQFATTTVTIPAGHRIARIPITLYPTKINPKESYGLPITIVSATGPSGQNLLVSGNAGVGFYAFIGNPIAGPYTQEWIRYNSATQTGTPAFDQTFPALFKALTPTQVTVQSGTGVYYIISFTDNNGVLSDFQVEFDPADVTANGITISDGPKVVVADPVNHKFEFNFGYVNSAGSPRNITDKFY